MASPSLDLVDLDERAIGAYVAIDTLEEMLLASPKESHTRQEIVNVCECIRRLVATWAE